MSYWQGYAPNYSRCVEAAHESVRSATDTMLHVMRCEYPKGAMVRVVHHRGEFVAHVTGWDADGCRISVRNIESGKDSKWWAAHVEVIKS